MPLGATTRVATTVAVVLASALCLHTGGVSADESSHQYTMGEPVTLWLNKAGPYHNPQEAYAYYTLPYCKPDVPLHPVSKFAGIGEVLEGTEYINSGLNIKFRVDVPEEAVCTIPSMSSEDAACFLEAVSQHYWYQLELDELPVWGMVGEGAVSSQKTHVAPDASGHESYDTVYIYTHKKMSISFNGDRIIEVNLTSDRPVEVRAGVSIPFTYSVKWVETAKPFETRFNRYLDHSFFEHQIHWFSIFNSFMMVVFLCGLVALILMRTLRNDYAKYMRDEEDLDDSEKGMGDESGWKLVHGDVFRRPHLLTVYAAVIGTGYQLIALIFAVILIALMGSLYVDRGAITTTSIVAYALTSIVSGYKSGSIYRSYYYPNPSPGWIQTMLLTAVLFPFVVFAVIFMLNFIAIYYNTVNAIPFYTMVSVFMIWLFISTPLVLAGTYLGRHLGGTASWPCRVNHIPHPIPPRRWFASAPVVVAVTGVLPFGSIFIEMYYVFTSFWNYKFYYVYGFMLLVYLILIVVTCCVTVVAVYFLLNSEDYRWHWQSFFAAGSTAFYVFLYVIYYFVFKTSMSGFLQTAFYFGYMGLFCLGMWLLCGTIGVMASTTFVTRIYRNIKVD